MRLTSKQSAFIFAFAIVAAVGSLMLKPKPTPGRLRTPAATLTAYEQPGVIPPPIEEAEKEDVRKTNAEATPSRPQAESRSESSSSTADAITTVEIARARVGSGVAKTVTRQRARTVVATSTSRSLVANSQTSNDPYHDSMLPGGSKWTTPISTVPANARTVSVRTPSATTETSVTTASAEASTSSLTTSTTTAAGCLTITTNFQQDCATANRWLDDIGTKYGALMQRHYRWLTAATVGDWRVNGCDPSPCDASGAGRIQPPDYYGAQGYDSPLGTCHSTTPFRRAGAGRCSRKDESLGCSAPGAMSTLGVLGGTLGDDGRVRGWVRWHGGWYVGTVEDATCVDACAVAFDHPCDLSEETEEPAQRFGVDGKRFWSWWWGGDVNGEPPW